LKILVTGGAGFIASHVVDLYIENGFDVVVVDNLSNGRAENVNPAATLYTMDIRDPQLAEVFATEKPDVVNHHAAQINVRRSVADPLYDAEVNILGSLRLIELAKAYNVQHFIYISSGGAIYGEPEYLPCDEEHPIVPICQYGASKHTVEHYLYMDALNHGLRYTVLRYGNVYGPRQDPEGEAGVVSIFTDLMLAGRQPAINGDGEQSRDFVYVTDCAQANLLALTVPHENRAYNVGTGRAASVNEIYHYLGEASGFPHPAVHGPAKVGETRHIYLSIDRIRQELGWEPEVDLAEGLSRTIAYFQQQKAA